MTYARPWKSFAEQLELLKSRGMLVADEAGALRFLEQIGYYRLSAYWYPFRGFQLEQDATTGKITHKPTDKFVANTDFSDSVALYHFDKKLRSLVYDALEHIEVALRVDIAYTLGKKDTFAHHNVNCFHPTFANKVNSRSNKTAFTEWQEKYNGLIDRSKEDFVEHYKRTHGNQLPVWVAIETWDFGVMSQLFALMTMPDQKIIADKYGVSDWKVFQSWLRSMNYLRNIIAHHSRLWNRNIIDQPKQLTSGTFAWFDSFIGKNDLIAKPFLLLSIVRHLLSVICPTSDWPVRLRAHLEAFPNQNSDEKRSIRDIGATENWKEWW